MKIALAQLNPTVGDLQGNAALVQQAAKQALADGAELMICTELVISGYPPKDLLLRQGFVEACDRSVRQLAQYLDGNIGVVVGHPSANNLGSGRIANAASLLHGGEVTDTIHKSLLPNYDVFDEERYFRPADRVQPMEFRGRRLGVHICEDAWYGQPATFYHDEPARHQDPIDALAAAGAEILINLSASPFQIDKPNLRSDILREHVCRHRVPFAFVNQVGGNDDLVFDGNSLLLDANGNKVLQLAGFRTDLQFIELDQMGSGLVLSAESEQSATRSADTSADKTSPDPISEADLLDALILGLRDYLGKCGFTDCVLGLSGGIDSALACYIAVQAVGAEHVHGLLMPSRFSSRHSVDDARQLAENLKIDHEIIPIDQIHQTYESTPVVRDDLGSQPAGLADQNLQARIRGALVMIRSNRHGWLALATGNKSELAVGYCTLYGDMVGGFAVLSDIFKQDVYAISRYVNEVRESQEAIPRRVLSKAPSAELAPDQFDQDTLPPYEVLDSILQGLIEREESINTLSQHHSAETVRWVANRLYRNEFKRRQMPPGIKLSQRAFGSGRRMPMAARFDAT